MGIWHFCLPITLDGTRRAFFVQLSDAQHSTVSGVLERRGPYLGLAPALAFNDCFFHARSEAFKRGRCLLYMSGSLGGHRAAAQTIFQGRGLSLFRIRVALQCGLESWGALSVFYIKKYSIFSSEEFERLLTRSTHQFLPLVPRDSSWWTYNELFYLVNFDSEVNL